MTPEHNLNTHNSSAMNRFGTQNGNYHMLCDHQEQLRNYYKSYKIFADIKKASPEHQGGRRVDSADPCSRELSCTSPPSGLQFRLFPLRCQGSRDDLLTQSIHRYVRFPSTQPSPQIILYINSGAYEETDLQK